MSKDKKMKIILDTDIGSDIDDVLALSYLLNQPKCDLLGITTVSGEAEKRAELASAICIENSQPNIPIYSGFSEPYFGEQNQPKCPQARILKEWEHKKFNKSNSMEAINFLRETIKSNPGEVKLVTIGPLTNIAYLFKIDPEIVEMLDSIIMMLGVFSTCPYETHKAEWNALLDPLAAEIVYDKIKIIPNLSVGLDVTMQCQISSKESLKTFNKDKFKIIKDAAGVWAEERDLITFHDPLAVASIFNTSLIKTRKGEIEVELKSEKVSGLTFWKQNKDGQHTIAEEVKVDEFFEEYFSVIDLKR